MFFVCQEVMFFGCSDRLSDLSFVPFSLVRSRSTHADEDIVFKCHSFDLH